MTGRYKLKPQNERTAAMGAAFRKARKGARVTLMGARDALGRSLWSIRQHEAGMIMLRLDEVARAAELFGVSVAELAGESGKCRKVSRAAKRPD